MTERYEAIVIGLGAMGSAATYHLAKQGVNVLGIEMFEPGHDQGSSHGHHRMFRTSHVHNDGYVPLSKRTIELWNELQDASGVDLITMNGEVHIRDATNAAKMELVKQKQAEGTWEVLDEQTLGERFPGFRLHEGTMATYEANAGFVRSERGIITHVEMAKQHGATIRTSEEVTAWKADGDGVTVTTINGKYSADRLVISAGPWSEEMLGSLEFPMFVERSFNGFFEPDRPDLWTIEQGAPNFLFSVPEGSFYGISSIDGIGVKIGLSSGTGKEKTTARTIRRQIDEEEIQLLRHVLDRYMPGSAGREIKRITCMCTYTVDSGFIVDHHPEHPQVIIACGFSGLGFKFSPVVGEMLAALTTGQKYPIDFSFMSANRFLVAAS